MNVFFFGGGGELHRVHSPQLMYRFLSTTLYISMPFFVFCCSLLVRNGFNSVYSRCLLVRVLVKSRAGNYFLDEEIGSYRCFVSFLWHWPSTSLLCCGREVEKEKAHESTLVSSRKNGKIMPHPVSTGSWTHVNCRHSTRSGVPRALSFDQKNTTLALFFFLSVFFMYSWCCRCRISTCSYL